MKKSKILMPLTGIAAVGAFAPVIAMSACHKENKLIKSYELTNTDGCAKGLIGADKLSAGNDITFGIKGKLSFVPAINHSFTRTIKVQESDSKVIKTKVASGVTINPTSIKEDEFEVASAITLTFGTAEDIATFKQGTKDETFTFEVEYEELDGSSTPKSVNKWTEKYSVTVFHKRVSCPVFAESSLQATVSAGTTAFALSGWGFSSALTGADSGVTVAFKDKTDLVVREAAVQDGREITLKGDQTKDLAAGDQAIKFDATLTKGQWPATGSVTFAPGDTTITLVVSNTKNFYVVDSWEIDVKLDSTKTIVVTMA